MVGGVWSEKLVCRETSRPEMAFFLNDGSCHAEGEDAKSTVWLLKGRALICVDAEQEAEEILRQHDIPCYQVNSKPYISGVNNCIKGQ